MRVAVIGGGITGLSAAYYLHQKKREFVLFEPGEPGGVIRTTQQGPFILEHGPNVLLEKPALRQLVSDLNLEPRYPALPNYRQYVYFSGRPHPVPKGIVPFARSSLLSATEKCRVLKNLAVPDAMRPRAEDESAAEFIGRLCGRGPVERILDPVLKGIYGGNVERLSARSLFPGMWQHASSKRILMPFLFKKKPVRIFTLPGGMKSLVKRIVESVPSGSYCRAQVEDLRHADGTFSVLTSAGKFEEFTHVLCATSGHATAGYIGGLNLQISATLEQLTYAGLLVLHASIPKSARLPDRAFGVLFPGGMPQQLLGVMFNSNIFPHTAAGDRHLLTICLGRTAPGVDFAALTEFLHSALGLGDLELLAEHHWPRAIPQYELGHYKYAGALRSAEEYLPGLKFIGADIGGVGVPDRIACACNALEN